jgi:hypothetical protein
VYVQLFRFDATRSHFLLRQSGYKGEVPQDPESLTRDHDQIKHRKAHLANCLKKLVTEAYNEKMVNYPDLVGKIHTPRAKSKVIRVPLLNMNALMRFVSDALLAAIPGLEVDEVNRARALRAFNKLLWLQNDLITRRYAA